MKPKNLKCPFTWRNRYVLIQDRVWYVPEYYDAFDQFTFPGWNSPDFFGNDRPVHIEYCSGNGDWIIQKAQQFPEFNWVAVEKQFQRVRKIWSKAQNHNISNLIIVSGEGYTVSHHYIPDQTVSEVYVNFPDPWPKERHKKHRIIQPRFTQEIGRILKDNGKFALATDDPNYSREMIEVLQQTPGFASCYPDPFYVSEEEGYGSSWFEELWRKKGFSIRYHQFQKRDSSS